jgi:hypothetical protein
VPDVLEPLYQFKPHVEGVLVESKEANLPTEGRYGPALWMGNGSGWNPVGTSGSASGLTLSSLILLQG